MSHSSSLVCMLGAAALLLLVSSHHRLAAHAQSCGSLTEDELIQRRINSLRTNVLAQLGLPEIPDPPPENTTAAPPTNATVEEYRVLVNASRSIEENREKKCVSEDFYAKPVSFFAGSMFLDGKHNVGHNLFVVVVVHCMSVGIHGVCVSECLRTWQTSPQSVCTRAFSHYCSETSQLWKLPCYQRVAETRAGTNLHRY